MRSGSPQATSHDALFKGQVQQALEEADRPDTVFIPQEVVMGNLEVRLDRIAAQKGKKS